MRSRRGRDTSSNTAGSNNGKNSKYRDKSNDSNNIDSKFPRLIDLQLASL